VRAVRLGPSGGSVPSSKKMGFGHSAAKKYSQQAQERLLKDTKFKQFEVLTMRYRDCIQTALFLGCN
jgi:hypothetical protein